MKCTYLCVFFWIFIKLLCYGWIFASIIWFYSKCFLQYGSIPNVSFNMVLFQMFAKNGIVRQFSNDNKRNPKWMKTNKFLSIGILILLDKMNFPKSVKMFHHHTLALTNSIWCDKSIVNCNRIEFHYFRPFECRNFKVNL